MGAEVFLPFEQLLVKGQELVPVALNHFDQQGYVFVFGFVSFNISQHSLQFPLFYFNHRLELGNFGLLSGELPVFMLEISFGLRLKCDLLLFDEFELNQKRVDSDFQFVQFLVFFLLFLFELFVFALSFEIKCNSFLLFLNLGLELFLLLLRLVPVLFQLPQLLL